MRCGPGGGGGLGQTKEGARCCTPTVRSPLVHLAPASPSPPPLVPHHLQLFLEQNEEEAEKMAEKEEKQKEIVQSTIKVGAGGRGVAAGCWLLAVGWLSTEACTASLGWQAAEAGAEWGVGASPPLRQLPPLLLHARSEQTHARPPLPACPPPPPPPPAARGRGGKATAKREKAKGGGGGWCACAPMCGQWVRAVSRQEAGGKAWAFVAEKAAPPNALHARIPPSRPCARPPAHQRIATAVRPPWPPPHTPPPPPHPTPHRSRSTRLPTPPRQPRRTRSDGTELPRLPAA